MGIDWSATGAWMQAWAGFTQAAAIFGAAIIAQRSFKSWRQQKLEERRINAADSVLSLVYELKRAFSVIRSPSKTPREIEQATINLIESGLDFDSYSTEKQERVVDSQIVLNRINLFTSSWNKIPELSPTTSAILGEDVGIFLTKLYSQKIAIEVAAEQYPDIDKDDPLFTAIIATLWENRARQADHEDRVGREVGETIAAIERLLLPIIRNE